MVKTWEFERFFNDDIREKRKAGSGSFHRRGKGVKHGISGALRTPSYYLSTKEKNKLNGEVKVTNMFTTIIPYQEFEIKDEETKKNLLTKWREVFENDKIIADLGISNKRYFDMVQDWDLPKKRRGGAGNFKKGRAKKETQKTNTAIAIEPPINTVEVSPTTKTQIQKIISKGLYLEYNGDYDSEQLNKLFTKLQLLIDGETSKYNISLCLTEKED